MTVFLDVDGVLVDFTKAVFLKFGIPYDYAKLPRPMNYWWFSDYGLSNNEVDAVCTYGFFAGLQWMQDGQTILSWVEEKFGRENIYLISAVMPNPQSFSGRMMWINRHVPQYNNRTWLGRIPKEILVAPQRVLIDDCSENYNKFLASGGRGILIPRPWNDNWCSQTLPFLLTELEKF